MIVMSELAVMKRLCEVIERSRTELSDEALDIIIASRSSLRRRVKPVWFSATMLGFDSEIISSKYLTT
jgi:hypothetical protein